MARHKCKPCGAGTLTGNQHDILLYGVPFFPGGGAEFESEVAARVAWNKHRGELMAEVTQAGRRPAAYYRYDLSIEKAPAEWFDEVGALESRDLLTRDEEFRLVTDRRELAPDQDATFHPPIGNRSLSASTLECCRAEALFVSGWHGRRGRMALEAKYNELAGCLAGWIAEKDT